MTCTQAVVDAGYNCMVGYPMRRRLESWDEAAYTFDVRSPMPGAVNWTAAGVVSPVQ